MLAYRKVIPSICLIIVAVFFSRVVEAAPVSGTFVAERSCPAYVSKNKQTNPDQAADRVGLGRVVTDATSPANRTRMSWP